MDSFTPITLLVDAEKLRELVRRRGVDESTAVRQAIEHALAAEEMMAVIRELHERDGVQDVFARLPDE